MPLPADPLAQAVQRLQRFPYDNWVAFAGVGADVRLVLEALEQAQKDTQVLWQLEEWLRTDGGTSDPFASWRFWYHGDAEDVLKKIAALRASAEGKGEPR